MVGVWRYSVALETSIEASIGFLALIDQLLSLLGMSQVVVSYLTKISVGNLLLEIISWSRAHKATLVRDAELVRLVIEHDSISGANCEPWLVQEPA